MVLSFFFWVVKDCFGYDIVSGDMSIVEGEVYLQGILGIILFNIWFNKYVGFVGG